MTLSSDIEQFQRQINSCLEITEYLYRFCDQIQEADVEELSYFFRQLQELCEELDQQLSQTGDNLLEINHNWGDAAVTHYSPHNRVPHGSNFACSSSISAINTIASNNANLNMTVGATYTTQLEPDFVKLLNALISAQDNYQIFKNLNIAKGKIGESLCHAFLPEVMDSSFFLEGQTGLTVETTTEKLAYQAAKEFLTKNPSIEYAIASRDFSGGDPYSVDSVLMLINRKDVANWGKSKRSTANYLVFECKTDKSQLSKAQSVPSYVQKQAKYMENNTLGLEDRHQLGKDLLQAISEGRTAYIAWHLDTSSGKVTARRIS